MNKNQLISIVTIVLLLGLFQNCGQTGSSSNGSNDMFEITEIENDSFLDPSQNSKSLNAIEGSSLSLSLNLSNSVHGTTQKTAQQKTRHRKTQRSILNLRRRRGSSRLQFDQDNISVNSLSLEDEGNYSIMMNDGHEIDLDLRVIPRIELSTLNAVVRADQGESKSIRVEFRAPVDSEIRWLFSTGAQASEVADSNYTTTLDPSENQNVKMGYSELSLDNIDGSMVGNYIFSVRSESDGIYQSKSKMIVVTFETQNSSHVDNTQQPTSSQPTSVPSTPETTTPSPNIPTATVPQSNSPSPSPQPTTPAIKGQSFMIAIFKNSSGRRKWTFYGGSNILRTKANRHCSQMVSYGSASASNEPAHADFPGKAYKHICVHAGEVTSYSGSVIKELLANQSSRLVDDIIQGLCEKERSQMNRYISGSCE